MTTPTRTELRLTGTRIAEFFRFGCERQLRLELAPPGERAGLPGDGPAPAARPGAGLLAAAGRRWERRKLHQLLGRLGEERVLIAGWTPSSGPRRLPADRVVEALRAPGEVEVLVQPELRLRDPDAFARRLGVELGGVALAPAVPDLIRIRRLPDGRARFQVIDIKASAEARAAHFAQVAFYTLLLEEICRQEEIAGGAPDVRWGRVWARDGRGPRRFALGAYRYHVRRFLREQLPRIAAAPPAAAAWHLSGRCAGCSHLDLCRAEADRADDLARVAGITPLAKQVLVGKGIGSVRALAKSFRRDTYQGCSALESQAERLKQRAQAVSFGKVFDVPGGTHLMPPAEDVRVILTAEGDPVTGRCFALGMRLDAPAPLRALSPASEAWLAERGTRAGERALLDALLARVDALLAGLDAANAERARTGARGAAPWSLHFYVYDAVELDLLRALLLRHLASRGERPGVARLLRFLSPRTVTAQPGVARSAPGTVLGEVVAALFALPVPYAYDLASVSARLRPAQDAHSYRPAPGYSWHFSSQVAFERIHNVWRDRPFGEQPPEAVREEIRATVLAKLAAIDSVVRAVRERAARRERLQMRKEPLLLGAESEPLADPTLETLRLFAELESVAEMVQTRALHALPSQERARRFECIRGMEFVERRPGGHLVFSFDAECRDVKFRVGDFNLVLTNDDGRMLLEADRHPWLRRRLMMELVEYDLQGTSPRVVLAPASGFAKAEAAGEIHLDRFCVLDRAPSDFNTRRVLATLRALDEGRGEAATVRALLAGIPPAGWTPPFTGADGVFDELRPPLNADQQSAWRAVFHEPVTLVWGPPGTGKTYLLAWMLVGLAAAARREGRPLRVLVAAATHRAIVNVLARLAAEMERAAPGPLLRAVKLRGSGSEADAELEGTGVELVADARLGALLQEADAVGEPLVVGSTVWSLWKRMNAAEDDEPDAGAGGAPLQPWFDVVVIDEASQIKVAEALIALSSLRAGGQVILCGDDKQLAPVVRGDYGPDVGPLFGSVFEQMARHYPKRILRESRRMNEALVDYPRRIHYPGLVSMVPERRVRVVPGARAGADDDLLRELFLDPADAVVLCTYRGVRAAARNPFEARLAARLARLARERLLDPRTGERYTAAEFVAEGLAVISPHRAQNSAVHAELRALGLAPEEIPVVDTVERMQGNEREMIVVSYAVADREYAEAEADFLLDPNRFNVSITRARAKLVVLMSEAVLDALPLDERVLTGSMAVKGYPAHCRDRVREVELPGPEGERVEVTCRYRMLPS